MGSNEARFTFPLHFVQSHLASQESSPREQRLACDQVGALW